MSPSAKMLPNVTTLRSEALSPFHFGGTEKGWHEIESLIRCPKEYQFAIVRGIARRSVVLSEGLSIGSLFHVARAQWLSDGRPLAGTGAERRWRSALISYAREHEAVLVKPLMPGALAIATRLMEAYVEYWSVRPCTKVLAVEYTVNPQGIDPSHMEWVWRTARLDSVEVWRGRTWIGEAKTTSSSAARVKDIYMLHGQTLLGACLWGPKEKAKFGELAGVLLDPVVKASGRRAPKPGDRIPLPMSEMEHALRWFPPVFAEHVRQSNLVTWNSGPERRITSCMRPHGPCEYRSLCLRGKRGAIGYVFRDGTPIAEWLPSPGKEVPPWD